MESSLSGNLNRVPGGFGICRGLFNTVIVISFDLLTTDPYHRKLFSSLLNTFTIDPPNNALTAEHTHNRPPLTLSDKGLGDGDP